MNEFPAVIESPGERMVFLVRSDENPTVQYRVDTLANGGAGACACKNFNMVKQTGINEGKLAWTHDTTCKHMKRAAWHVIRLTFRELAHREDHPPRNRVFMTVDSYLHKPCSFDDPNHAGARLVGIITECVTTKPFGKGEIPDFKVTIRGNSGRTLETTVCAAHLQLTSV